MAAADYWGKLVATAPVGIFRTTLDGKILYVNDAIVRMLEYDDAEELKSKGSVATYRNPGDRKGFIKGLRESDRITNFEAELLTKDGTPITILVSAFLEGSEITGIFMDISERKQAEDALRESEERYRQLAENIEEVFWMVSPDWNQVHYISPAYEKVWGRSCASLLQNPRSWLDPIVEDDRRKILDTIDNIDFENENDPPVFEYRIIRPDGSLRWIHSRAFPVRNEQGRIYRAAGVAADITARKLAEEEIKRSNQELEQFASIVTHDLREPVRSIGTSINYLKKFSGGNLSAEADEFLQLAVEGAQRIDKLILDLFEYSKVAARGKEFKQVDCNKGVKSAIASLSRSITGSNAKVTFDSLPTITGDASQIIRLFQNLIHNAIKFGGDGPPAIHVSAEQQGTMWRFSVKDNGIGIDPKFSELVFEVFRQLHPTDKLSGTGIGLAICKKIVQKHGGQISLESKPGKGTIVSFTLPAVTEN